MLHLPVPTVTSFTQASVRIRKLFFFLFYTLSAAHRFQLYMVLYFTIMQIFGWILCSTWAVRLPKHGPQKRLPLYKKHIFSSSAASLLTSFTKTYFHTNVCGNMKRWKFHEQICDSYIFHSTPWTHLEEPQTTCVSKWWWRCCLRTFKHWETEMCILICDCLNVIITIMCLTFSWRPLGAVFQWLLMWMLQFDTWACTGPLLYSDQAAIRE